jgi:hypothetical protein
MKSMDTRKTTHAVWWIIVLSICISSCTGKYTKATKIANKAGLKSAVLQTSKFNIQSFYRFTKRGDPLTIYIEGDGQAWLTRTQPSMNPTPRNPIALRMAALDRGKNVIYLARPCMYVDLSLEKFCSVPYWTHKRFAKVIILAINEAINIMASRSEAKKIHLIGYSGGGAVVAMLAARRKKIASIRTVAGYMDHVALNRKAKVSPLIGSLDPIRAAPRLKSTPQIHYSGRQDKRVPSWVLHNFSKAVGDSNCVTIRKVNATHEEGWEKIWANVWSKIPTCN